jgi:hypothetical protein
MQSEIAAESEANWNKMKSSIDVRYYEIYLITS